MPNTLSVLNNIPKTYNFKDNTLINTDKNRYLLHTHTLYKYSKEAYGKYIFIQDISAMYKNQKQIIFQSLKHLLLLI